MAWRLMAAMLLVSVMAAPGAVAGHADEKVRDVEDKYVVVRTYTAPDDGTRLVGDAVCELIFPACIDPTYETTATVEIWEETNECEGLQKEPGDCDDDADVEDNDDPVAVVGCTSHGESPCGTPNVF